MGAETTGPRGPEVAPIAGIAFGADSLGMVVAVLKRMRINLIRLGRIEPPRRGG